MSLITEIIAYKLSLADWEKGALFIHYNYVYKFGSKLVICML